MFNFKRKQIEDSEKVKKGYLSTELLVAATTDLNEYKTKINGLSESEVLLRIKKTWP